MKNELQERGSATATVDPSIEQVAESELVPRRTRYSEALILLMLGAFAVTQPILSDFREGAGYFVARRNEAIDIVLFVVVLTLLPGMLANLIVWAAAAYSEKARAICQAIFVGLFAALIAHTSLVRLTSISWIVLMGISVVIGGLVVLAYRRTTWARRYLTYLIPAPLIFAVIFLFTPPVLGLVFPARTNAVEATVVSDTPVVFVVFDEFPVMSLLDANGAIDVARYPNFAELASISTWYPHTVAAHDFTSWALPAMLTGQVPDTSRLPTAAQYPENLFALFESSHELHVLEPFTRLCSPDMCGDAERPASSGDRLKTLGADSLRLYHGLLMPEPDATAAVADPFNELSGGPARVWQRAPLDLVGQFRGFLSEISPGPTLHFAHVLLPHAPFSYYPSGVQYNNGDELAGQASGGWVDPVLAHQAQGRHLLQVQAMDNLVGDLLARLEIVGILDEALIVVTADHGISFQPGVPGRALTDENIYDVGLVPLFIKAPHQAQAARDTRLTQTIDVLPTVANHLLIDLPWKTDGRTLLEPAVDSRPASIQAREGGEISIDNAEAGLASSLSRLYSLFGSEDGAFDPYSIGGYDSIVGSPAASLSLSSGPSGLEAKVDEAWRLIHVAPDLGFVPGFIHGTISGDVLDDTHVAVALNGVVRAVVPVFEDDSDVTRFNAIIPDNAFVPGFNALDLFAITGPPSSPLVQNIEFDGANRTAMSRAENGDVISIVDSAGTSWQVAHDPRIVGGVDEAAWAPSDFMRSTLEDLQLAGWAVDQRSLRPVEQIVVFINGVFAGTVEPNRARADIEDGYQNSQVRFSGFRVRLSQFLPVGSMEVRAFALSEGNAVELTITEAAQAVIAAG
jgi:hypothetical protein